MTHTPLHEVITDYWYENYCSDHCTLCGNSGVIDTTGVKTPAGVTVGRKNWCICPNGQSIRSQVSGKTPYDIQENPAP